jgi:hypothetical protein
MNFKIFLLWSFQSIDMDNEVDKSIFLNKKNSFSYLFNKSFQSIDMDNEVEKFIFFIFKFFTYIKNLNDYI